MKYDERKPGRPRKNPKYRRDLKLSVWVSRDERATIHKNAEREEKETSEFIRERCLREK